MPYAEPPSAGTTTPETQPVAAPGLGELFMGFLKIGLMGFGGVGPIARHIIVVERRWLDDAAYAELIGLCQAMPGANTVNSAVVLGDRYRGIAGALTCVVALMAVPLLALIGLASIYDAVSDHPLADVALTGAAASAAGLIMGTAAKLLTRAGMAPWGWVVAAAAMLSVAALRLPLVHALAILVPVALILAVWSDRRR